MYLPQQLVAFLSLCLIVIRAAPLVALSTDRPECSTTQTLEGEEPFTFDFPSAQNFLLDLDLEEAQADPLATACNVSIPIQFNNWHVDGSTDRLDGYISDQLFAEAVQRLNTNYADLTRMSFSYTINRIPMTADAWANWNVSSSDTDIHEEIGTTIKGDNPTEEVLRTIQVNIVNDALSCGFSYVPTSRWSRRSLLRDGIYLDTRCFDGHPQFRATTLTHEVGHWLGIYHTFEGGCESPGDYVNDTPPAVAPVDQPTLLYDDCNMLPTQTSCGDINSTAITVSLSNYMSYAVDECRTTFTQGQVDRMYAVLAFSREFPTASTC